MTENRIEYKGAVIRQYLVNESFKYILKLTNTSPGVEFEDAESAIKYVDWYTAASQTTADMDVD